MLTFFSSRDQIDLTCEILKRILGAIPIGHAMVRYEDLFLQGLAHSENRVKELIFQEVWFLLIEPQNHPFLIYNLI